jgi:hypothetical protein
MNYARVLLGGLVAGLVLNIGEYVLNEIVLGPQMRSFFTQHNFPPPSGNFIAIAVVMTFLLGILIVMLYAMIRPRYGPGPKTAICAALVVWFCICIYTGIINGVLFGITANIMILAIVWCLIEYCLAAIAGAWVYKEA